jgi:hypothetical protein
VRDVLKNGVGYVTRNFTGQYIAHIVEVYGKIRKMIER